MIKTTTSARVAPGFTETYKATAPKQPTISSTLKKLGFWFIALSSKKSSITAGSSGFEVRRASPSDSDFIRCLLCFSDNVVSRNREGRSATVANTATQQLLDKLKRSGKPLGEYVQGKIFYGIKTGLNEAFVIDEATKERLISEDPRSAELIKPFLAGRDVKRYQVPKADKYLLFTRRGVDIEQYPAIKRHLEQFRTQLEPCPKDWTGKTDGWPGRKPGSYAWYEIQDSVDYYKEFEQEKIIFPDLANIPQFTIDTSLGAFSANTTYFIPKGDYFLLGLLNSKLLFFYYKSAFSSYRGGHLRFFTQYVAELPLCINNETLVAQITNKTKERLSPSPTADTSALEAEIDALVYALYELTEAEIALVSGGV